MTPDALRGHAAKIRRDAASAHFGDPRYSVMISADKVDALIAAVPELLVQVTDLEQRLAEVSARARGLEVENAGLRRDAGETSASIAAWQTETFGPATTREDRMYRSWEAMDEAWAAVRDMDWSIRRPNLARALRAAEELAELISLLVVDDADPGACPEVADVQIVLAGIPAAHGQEQRDLVDAKMIANRARRWEITGDGHGQHVGEDR